MRPQQQQHLWCRNLHRNYSRSISKISPVQKQTAQQLHSLMISRYKLQWTHDTQQTTLPLVWHWQYCHNLLYIWRSQFFYCIYSVLDLSRFIVFVWQCYISLRQVSQLTEEQKEKIASGPTFDQFLSDAKSRKVADYSSYTGALKSKSGERLAVVPWVLSCSCSNTWITVTASTVTVHWYHNYQLTVVGEKKDRTKKLYTES